MISNTLLMKGLNLCINSQTPLVRFKLQYAELLEKYGELPRPGAAGYSHRGRGLRAQSGGVPKIVFPLMNRMIKENLVENAHWVSLNPVGPITPLGEDVSLYGAVALALDRLPSTGTRPAGEGLLARYA